MSGTENLLLELAEAQYTVMVSRKSNSSWTVCAMDNTKKRKPTSASSNGTDLQQCLIDVKRILQVGHEPTAHHGFASYEEGEP
jgi:hypothetical protein